MIAPEQPDPRPSVFALLAALIAEARALFGAELALASAEFRLNTIRLVLALAVILAGGLMLGTGSIALLVALIAALIPVLGPVGAALVTALVAFIAAAALIIAGVRAIRTGQLAPKRAIANLKANANTVLKRQMQEQRDDQPRP